ncbi:hypothetical protein D6774_00280 [Candidatus Woesearchaeota archaeon]|nr:MAG: hypothetical protein D6774_00280 [Candidatus Woesearchaeota archaeon]
MILILLWFGLLLSLYAVFVNYRLNASGKYQPLCDFSPTISCSKAFTSTYARTFGTFNGLVGVIGYVALTLAYVYMPALFVIGVYIAFLMSIYLLFILLFRLHTYCIVCFSIYLVNFLLFILTLINL